jgi:rhodanese-related sulfurtransferase
MNYGYSTLFRFVGILCLLLVLQPVWAIKGLHYPQSSLMQVNSAEAKKLIDKEKAQILDVRTKQEWNEDGYIQGARLVDFYAKDFLEQVAKLDKTKPVLVYCAVGGRSSRAAKKLMDGGFTKVYNLTGGIYQWQTDGMPLSKAK